MLALYPQIDVAPAKSGKTPEHVGQVQLASMEFHRCCKRGDVQEMTRESVRNLSIENAQMSLAQITPSGRHWKVASSQMYIAQIDVRDRTLTQRRARD